MITQNVGLERVKNGESYTDEIGVSVTMAFGMAPRMVIHSVKKKDGMFAMSRVYRVHSLDLTKVRMDGLGFALKRDPDDIKDGEPTEYHVFLSEDRNFGDMCDCQGFYRYKRCKHIPAMRAAVGDAE
jgi:hypothetical protein